MKVIYDTYALYHQGGGFEQSVFDPAGHSVTRSVRLLELLRESIGLPKTGRMLDIGYGNGSTLQAFGRMARHWELCGTELDEKNREMVRALPGVVELYTSPPPEVPGQFDLITMIHVLEHVPSPEDFLRSLCK